MTTTTTLRITGMHCASCGLLVDDELEDIDGVDRATTDARRGVAVVTYDPARVAVSQLLAAVTAAGYVATPD